MQILYWKIPEKLKDELESHYKTNLSHKIENSNPMDIIHQITFDNAAPNLSLKQVRSFIDFVNKKIIQNKITGVGLEVGSGPGTFTALLSEVDNVAKIYGVEACSAIVEDLMPKVTKYIVKDVNRDKIYGCVGDFDNIELPDNSVDFIFDFFSLHHSENLSETSKELYRVLKPGGVVVCFDKARDDKLTDDDLETLLDIEYPEKVKINMGLDPKKSHTRRMNGEKEYRLKDWRKVFLNSNFAKFEHFHVARTLSRNKAINILKNIFSKLPPRFQTYFTKFLTLKSTNNMSSSGRIYTKLIKDFPKEISLMVAYK